MNERDEINTYFDGVLEGISQFAHWKDGVQYVGTCGKTLKQAKDEVEHKRSQVLRETAFA